MAQLFHSPTLFALGALTSAAAFTGVGLHLTFSENAIRQELTPSAAAQTFTLCYPRVMKMQVSFIGVTAFLGGVAAYLASGVARRVFGAGAVLMTLIVPYTGLALIKINHSIMETDPSKANEETLALVKTWGERNLPRPLLSLTSVALFAYGILQLN